MGSHSVEFVSIHVICAYSLSSLFTQARYLMQPRPIPASHLHITERKLILVELICVHLSSLHYLDQRNHIMSNPVCFQDQNAILFKTGIVTAQISACNGER